MPSSSEIGSRNSHINLTYFQIVILLFRHIGVIIVCDKCIAIEVLTMDVNVHIDRVEFILESYGQSDGLEKSTRNDQSRCNYSVVTIYHYFGYFSSLMFHCFRDSEGYPLRA